MPFSQRAAVLSRIAGLAGAVFACLCAVNAEECWQNDDVLLLPVRAAHASSIGDEFNALFCERTSDCLVELKQHREASVAIRAAWEEAKRALLNSELGSDINGPRHAMVERFLGFVEGRLEVAVPKSWERSMRAAHVGAHRHIGFRESSTEPTFSRELSIWLWPDLRVKLGDPCELMVGSNEVSLNRATFGQLKERGEMVWRAFVVDARYYIVVFDAMGNLADVLRINCSTGEVVWRANSSGTGWVVWGGRGRPGYNVEIVEHCATVYLFGSGAGGGIIEGYNVKSGAAVLRFATTDWRQPDAKTEKAEESIELRRTERESSTGAVKRDAGKLPFGN